MTKYKILDLFCGAGGLSYGMHKNVNFSTAIAVDNDVHAAETFKKNTLSHLVENIALILPEYEINGKKSSYGKRSHTSVRQALRRFKMFLISNKLIESVK